MKRQSIIVSALLCLNLCTLSAQTANAILDNFIETVESNTLVTDITMSIAEKAAQPISYSGKLQLRGEQFILSIFGTEAAYDGKTLYLYSADTDELTLTYPTEEELLEVNPVLFAKALRLKADVRFSAANKSQDIYSIDIIPHAKEAGISKFVIKLHKTTYLPQEITVTEDTQTSKLLFRNTAFSPTPPQCTITKPDAFLNDLR